MQENVIVKFSKAVTSDKQTAIVAALQAELDARAAGTTVVVTIGDIKSSEFEIDYSSSYAYHSQDAAYNGSDSTSFSVQGKQSDSSDVITRFLVLRSDWIIKSYRNAIRSVGNVGTYYDQGTATPPAGVSQAAYLSNYAYAICDAFPNTN